MDQALIANRRDFYRVKTVALLACAPVPAASSGGDHIKQRLPRIIRYWVNINISLGGILFPSKWKYDCGDVVEMTIRPIEGKDIRTLAKVVRVEDTDTDLIMVAARFIQLGVEDERRLASLIIDCQRRECIGRR